jgi:hypothetical protein
VTRLPSEVLGLSFSLFLCQAKAEAAVLVIIDELDSGFFERCLDPNHCRNIACDCLTAFFYPLNRGPCRARRPLAGDEPISVFGIFL